MGVRKVSPIEIPAEVLDRVLGKGIVASASLRPDDGPIELARSAGRVVAEAEVYLGAAAVRQVRAA
jgi:hypothetical protein